MKTYLDMLQTCVSKGEEKSDRTSTGTLSIGGYQFRHDLRTGFPLLTTKRIHWQSVVVELLWMLSGDTNIKTLQRQGVSIWDEWADDNGDLGPIYGEQWRSWDSYDDARGELDQILGVLHTLKEDPDSRRHIVSAWNVADLDKMALPPCHMAFQFYVANGKLTTILTQRSGDLFLGVPFNIASYALLTHLVCRHTNLEPKELVINYGDLHLYKNHLQQAKEQLARAPTTLPLLELRGTNNIFEVTRESIHLTGYNPSPHIAAPVAV